MGRRTGSREAATSLLEDLRSELQRGSGQEFRYGVPGRAGPSEGGHVCAHVLLREDLVHPTLSLDQAVTAHWGPLEGSVPQLCPVELLL